MENKVALKIRPYDPDAPGFLPSYQNLLAAKRALSDFQHAQPEDIDNMYELLCEHITEPDAKPAKMAELKKLSIKQLNTILETLMGNNIVPPENDAG